MPFALLLRDFENAGGFLRLRADGDRSPIVPVEVLWRFLLFLDFLRTISLLLEKIFSSNAYISESNRSIGIFLNRPGGKTRKKILPKKIPKIFGQHEFFEQTF